MKIDRYGDIVFIEDTIEYRVWPSALEDALEKEQTLLWKTLPEMVGWRNDGKAPTLEEWRETSPKTREESRLYFHRRTVLLELQALYVGRKLLRTMERDADLMERVLAPPKKNKRGKMGASVDTKLKCYLKAWGNVLDKKQKKKPSRNKTSDRAFTTEQEWLDNGGKDA